MKDLELYIRSSDPNDVTDALYYLMGRGKGDDVLSVEDVIPELIGSADEDIAWGAIMSFGVVRDGGKFRAAIQEAKMRWYGKAGYIVDAADAALLKSS